MYYKPFFCFFFSCTAFIYADEAAAVLQKEDETTVVLQKEEKSEPFCKAATETYSWNQDLSYETCTCVQEEREPMFFAVDWVYFKAVEDSLRYSIRFPATVDKIETINADSSCFEQKPSYRSGYRVSGALPSACGKWRIGGSWLNFISSPPSVHVESPDFGLVANYAIPNFGLINTLGTNAATGKWKLHVDEFDLVLQKRLCFDSKIILNPYAGVKGGIISQNTHVQYEGLSDVGTGSLPAPQSFRAKSSYWGVGPVLGIAINYPLTGSLQMFFDGSLAGVVGDFKVCSTYQDFVDNPSLEWLIKNTKTNLSIATQWRAGIQLFREMSRFLLQLEAGWEAHHWSGQMRMDSMATFILPQNSGADLSFYGPFFRILLAF